MFPKHLACTPDSLNSLDRTHSFGDNKNVNISCFCHSCQYSKSYKYVDNIYVIDLVSVN